MSYSVNEFLNETFGDDFEKLDDTGLSFERDKEIRTALGEHSVSPFELIEIIGDAVNTSTMSMVKKTHVDTFCEDISILTTKFIESIRLDVQEIGDKYSMPKSQIGLTLAANMLVAMKDIINECSRRSSLDIDKETALLVSKIVVDEDVEALKELEGRIPDELLELLKRHIEEE